MHSFLPIFPSHLISILSIQHSVLKLGRHISIKIFIIHHKTTSTDSSYLTLPQNIYVSLNTVGHTSPKYYIPSDPSSTPFYIQLNQQYQKGLIFSSSFFLQKKTRQSFSLLPRKVEKCKQVSLSVSLKNSKLIFFFFHLISPNPSISSSNSAKRSLISFTRQLYQGSSSPNLLRNTLQSEQLNRLAIQQSAAL